MMASDRMPIIGCDSYTVSSHVNRCPVGHHFYCILFQAHLAALRCTWLRSNLRPTDARAGRDVVCPCGMWGDAWDASGRPCGMGCGMRGMPTDARAGSGVVTVWDAVRRATDLCTEIKKLLFLIELMQLLYLLV